MKKVYELAIHENEQQVTRFRISGREFKEQFKTLTERVKELNEDIENSCLCLREYKKDYPKFIMKAYTFRFNLTDVTLYVFECKKGYTF